MKVLLIFLLGYPSMVLAGRILFFMPVMPKSSTFTFIPLVHELAKRGHKVTVVNPFGTKIQHPNLTEIKPKAIDIQGKMKAQSNMILRTNTTFFETMANTVGSISDFIYQWPKLFDELDQEHDFFNKKKFGFDMVICYGMLTNELGYFISHYFDTQLVLYGTVQSSTDWFDQVVGQPHNMAFQPFLGSTLR